MIFDYRGDSITITLETDEGVPTLEEILEAMACSIDITFGELLNEGFPVCLGNSYTEYRFTAYLQGIEYEYGLGPMERDSLENMRAVLVTTYGPYSEEVTAC